MRITSGGRGFRISVWQLSIIVFGTIFLPSLPETCGYLYVNKSNRAQKRLYSCLEARFFNLIFFSSDSLSTRSIFSALQRSLFQAASAFRSRSDFPHFYKNQKFTLYRQTGLRLRILFPPALIYHPHPALILCNDRT